MAGFPDRIASELIGSLIELQDNVSRHSQAHETGLAAYAIASEGFEMVVGDAGRGVLASLQSCSDYAHLKDSGEALEIAVADGESRMGRDSGSGYGMGQMFRALANHDGDLRFRSGDHALELSGHSPSLKSELKLRHKAPLQGLTITALCRPRPRERERVGRSIVEQSMPLTKLPCWLLRRTQDHLTAISAVPKAPSRSTTPEAIPP